MTIPTPALLDELDRLHKARALAMAKNSPGMEDLAAVAECDEALVAAWPQLSARLRAAEDLRRHPGQVRRREGAGGGAVSDMSPFWKLYHRLMDWTDDDGLPDPDKHDAANWILDMRSAIVVAANSGSFVARAAIDCIEHPKATRIFPLKPLPEKDP